MHCDKLFSTNLRFMIRKDLEHIQNLSICLLLAFFLSSKENYLKDKVYSQSSISVEELKNGLK